MVLAQILVGPWESGLELAQILARLSITEQSQLLPHLRNWVGIGRDLGWTMYNWVGFWLHF